ncbi:MAG: hypothetical protein ACT4R6_13730 [Gemmatimonadaceae bacterium]
MAAFTARSLRYEYELFVEQEIEHYKDSVPRGALLRIGDEAVTSLREQEQTSFDEILLWAEVDRIIRNRLRIPAFNTWKRRRLRRLEEYRRPERWGLPADGPLATAIRADDHPHVLVAGTRAEGPAIFLAARGCRVTALDEDPELVDHVIHVAGEAGLISRFTPCVSGLDRFEPPRDTPLTAVVCTSEALQRLTPRERSRVIDLLKSATLDGGFHLVQALAAGHSRLSLEELNAQYKGWAVSVVPDRDTSQAFVARKLVA